MNEDQFVKKTNIAKCIIIYFILVGQYIWKVLWDDYVFDLSLVFSSQLFQRSCYFWYAKRPGFTFTFFVFFSLFLVVSGFFCFHVFGGFCYSPMDPIIYFLSNKMYNLLSSISRKLSIECIDKCGDCLMDIRFDSLVGWNLW